jgi:hypothetical protein
LTRENIQPGSVWSSVSGVHFQVISETHIDGNDWIYYRMIDKETEEPKEFSCYKESFLSRFQQIPKN